MIYNIILPFVFIKLMLNINNSNYIDIIESFSMNYAQVIVYSNYL